jgi:hypothetical protein
VGTGRGAKIGKDFSLPQGGTAIDFLDENYAVMRVVRIHNNQDTSDFDAASRFEALISATQYLR